MSGTQSNPRSYDWLFGSVWHNGVDVHDGLEQVVDDLLTLLATNVLDLLQLLFVLLLSILLGLLVAASVLLREGIST